MVSNRWHLLTAALVCVVVICTPVFATQPETADDLFAHAKETARSEQKSVLLVFSASWCGPCKLYERFLEDAQMRDITEKTFVVQRIDVGERQGDTKHADTPGGVALRSALGAVGEPGFPFLVVTDGNGSPIMNSYRNGNTKGNIGYPASRAEIEWYIEMLKQGAPSLSKDDLDATRTWLRKHSPF